MSRARAFQSAWTIHRGTQTAQAGAWVVLVPPSMSLDSAFRRLRERVDLPGRPVLILGRGVTIERLLPEWLRGVPRSISLTELDAYLPREKSHIIASLVPSVERWLERVFAPLAPNLPPSTVLFNSAMERIFSDRILEWMLAAEIYRSHPEAEFESLDPTWFCYRVLTSMRSGEPCESARVRGRVTRCIGNALLFCATGAAAIGKRSYDFYRELPSRKRVRSSRARESGEKPTLWIAVSGSSERASRPVLDVIPPIAAKMGEPLGALLLTNLEAGIRSSPARGGIRRDAVLPTLERPELSRSVVAIDQLVSAECIQGLLRAFVQWSLLSARCASLALQGAAVLSDGERAVSFAVDGKALAKLLTADLLRVCEASEAAKLANSRRSFSGTTVIYPHATSPSDAVGIDVLRTAGARTIELVHGLTEIQTDLGRGRTDTAIKAYWTLPEAEAVRHIRTDQDCQGGFFPRPRPRNVQRRWPAAVETIPVLIASSYLPKAWGLRPELFEHYQQPFLRSVAEAFYVNPNLKIRWRPHPGDDADRIQRYLQRYPMLELSTGSLDQDLRWSQILITSMSSIVIEATEYSIPIFVHEIPYWDDNWLSIFEPERRFGLDGELAERLPRVVKDIIDKSPDLLAPEQRLRYRLFGASGVPRPLDDLLYKNESRLVGQGEGNGRWAR